MDAIRAGWGATDARGAIRQVITGEVDATTLSKIDALRQVNFDGWMAPALLNAYAGPKSRIFASLSAGDRVFKSYAMGRSLWEQADVIARSEGLKGDELAKRIKEIVETDMVVQARAIVDAEVATFTNRGGHNTFRSIDLGRAGEGVRDAFGPAGQVLTPFVRTPANVTDRVLEYSPLGFLGNISKTAAWLKKVKEAKANGLRPQDVAELIAAQREIVQQAGRASIGTGALAVGWVLAEKGWLSGNYPSEAAERNAAELANEQPNSILIDGKWYSLEKMSPLGNLLTLGAELHKMAHDPEVGTARAVAATPGALGKTVVNQSFLRGLQGGLDALAAPERSWDDFLRQTLSSTVPTVVAATARAVDPTMRDAQTIPQAFRARIPGITDEVPARIDALGYERTRGDGLASRVGQVFSPFSTRESYADDPIVAEIQRTGASIPPYRPRTEDRGTDEYEALQKEYGKAVRAALQETLRSAEYRSATDEEKAELLERAASSTRRRLTRTRTEEAEGRAPRPRGYLRGYQPTFYGGGGGR